LIYIFETTSCLSGVDPNRKLSADLNCKVFGVQHSIRQFRCSNNLAQHLQGITSSVRPYAPPEASLGHRIAPRIY
jgi:hypothetical protein